MGVQARRQVGPGNVAVAHVEVEFGTARLHQGTTGGQAPVRLRAGDDAVRPGASGAARTGPPVGVRPPPYDAEPEQGAGGNVLGPEPVALLTGPRREVHRQGRVVPPPRRPRRRVPRPPRPGAAAGERPARSPGPPGRQTARGRLPYVGRSRPVLRRRHPAPRVVEARLIHRSLQRGVAAVTPRAPGDCPFRAWHECLRPAPPKRHRGGRTAPLAVAVRWHLLGAKAIRPRFAARVAGYPGRTTICLLCGRCTWPGSASSLRHACGCGGPGVRRCQPRRGPPGHRSDRRTGNPGVRPRAARGIGRAHGMRPRQAHRTDGLLPGLVRLRHTPPPQRPVRRRAGPPAGGGPHRAGAATRRRRPTGRRPGHLPLRRGVRALWSPTRLSWRTRWTAPSGQRSPNEA